METPVGALGLHWLVTVVLMFATYTLSSSDAYSLLSSLYTYIIIVVFNLVIAIGVLKLRFDLREG